MPIDGDMPMDDQELRIAELEEEVRQLREAAGQASMDDRELRIAVLEEEVRQLTIVLRGVFEWWNHEGKHRSESLVLSRFVPWAIQTAEGVLKKVETESPQ
jgi:hypothetical protein